MRFQAINPLYLSHAGVIIEAGQEIGDGTDHPCRDADGNFFILPSANMRPMDDEARTAWEDAARRAGGAWGVAPENRLPITGGQDGTPIERSAPAPHLRRSEVHSPVQELTHPSDMAPGEGPRVNPIYQEALDREMEDRPRRVEERARAAEERRNAGADAATPLVEVATGIKTLPASTDVPRDSDKLTPQNPTGQFQDLSKQPNATAPRSEGPRPSPPPDTPKPPPPQPPKASTSADALGSKPPAKSPEPETPESKK